MQPQYLIDTRPGSSGGYLSSGMSMRIANVSIAELWVGSALQPQLEWSALPAGQWAHVVMQLRAPAPNAVTLMCRANGRDCLAGRLSEVNRRSLPPPHHRTAQPWHGLPALLLRWEERLGVRTSIRVETWKTCGSDGYRND